MPAVKSPDRSKRYLDQEPVNVMPEYLHAMRERIAYTQLDRSKRAMRDAFSSHDPLRLRWTDMVASVEHPEGYYSRTMSPKAEYGRLGNLPSLPFPSNCVKAAGYSEAFPPPSGGLPCTALHSTFSEWPNVPYTARDSLHSAHHSILNEQPPHTARDHREGPAWRGFQSLSPPQLSAPTVLSGPKTGASLQPTAPEGSHRCLQPTAPSSPVKHSASSLPNQDRTIGSSSAGRALGSRPMKASDSTGLRRFVSDISPRSPVGGAPSSPMRQPPLGGSAPKMEMAALAPFFYRGARATRKLPQSSTTKLYHSLKTTRAAATAPWVHTPEPMEGSHSPPPVTYIDNHIHMKDSDQIGHGHRAETSGAMANLFFPNVNPEATPLTARLATPRTAAPDNLRKDEHNRGLTTRHSQVLKTARSLRGAGIRQSGMRGGAN